MATLVSTVLQGVYQSNQATAAAVQVNNLHLLRGMIGKPGCTVFQMNGQPSAQNTRECGADGALGVFMNWQNPAHVERLLHAALSLGSYARAAWLVLDQAARARHDERLHAAARDGLALSERRQMWLEAKLHETSPEALTTSPRPRARLEGAVRAAPSPATLRALVPALAAVALVGIGAATALLVRRA